jgi:hypothetical protein
LRVCGPLAYTDNECAKQLVYALDDHVWGIKITALKESTDSTTLNTEKLFSKLKSHELSCKCHPNYDASFINNALITSARVGGHDANPTNAITNKALITSAHVGGHDANPTNTISPSLKFTLSSLAAASDEQYKSILDDEIALLAKKIRRYTSFGRRGEEALKTPGVASSAVTPPTSSPTVPRGRSTTTPTRTTTLIRMTTTIRMTTRRRIASGTRRRRTSRRSCPSLCNLEQI